MLVIFIPMLTIAVAALVGNFNLNTKLLMAGVTMILLYSFFDFQRERCLFSPFLFYIGRPVICKTAA